MPVWKMSSVSICLLCRWRPKSQAASQPISTSTLTISIDNPAPLRSLSFLLLLSLTLDSLFFFCEWLPLTNLEILSLAKGQVLIGSYESWEKGCGVLAKLWFCLLLLRFWWWCQFQWLWPSCQGQSIFERSDMPDVAMSALFAQRWLQCPASQRPSPQTAPEEAAVAPTEQWQ